MYLRDGLDRLETLRIQVSIDSSVFVQDKISGKKKRWKFLLFQGWIPDLVERVGGGGGLVTGCKIVFFLWGSGGGPTN